MMKTTLSILFMTMIFVSNEYLPSSAEGSQSGTYLAGESYLSPTREFIAAPVPGGDRFSVVIGESLTDFMGKVTDSSSCALITSDGSIHIERRQQILTDQPTTRVFEGKLEEAQIRELEDILNTTKVRQLPSFIPPKTPLSVRSFYYFDAEIRRERQHQRIGYFKWRGNVSPAASPASMPDDVKKAWQISETALQPLVHWFHSVQSVGQLSKEAPTQCRINSLHQNGDMD